MRAPTLPAVLLLAFMGALSATAACSNQGEGEVCSTANGNNDCQDGLFCQSPAPGVPPTLVNAARCCPIPPAQPTTAACSHSTGVIEASTEVGDVFVVPEGAPTSDAVSEAEAASSPETSVAEAGAAEARAPEASAPGPDASSADALPE